MTRSANVPDQTDASIDLGVIAMAVLRRLPRIMLVTVLLCAATFALLTFVPRQYESGAGLLVEPRANTFTRATSDVTSGFLIDDALVASQIELIKARDTILMAIEDADLRQERHFGAGQWSDSRLVSEIAGNLRVVQERSSRLVTVTYRSPDPELSARVANAIAEAHLVRRAGQQVADTRDATGWLEREIDGLRERVADAERRVAEFRVANDLFVGTNNTSLVDQQLSELSSQLTATAERRSAAQSRAQLIRSLLDAGQSVTGVNDVQSSPTVQQLSQDKARLQAERAQRSATLLSNHPTIRSLDAQIAEIDAQIAEEGRRVADALEVQARIEADMEASLQDELERLKLLAGTATREGVTLAELEREASAQRELLNAYLIRHSEAMARTEVDSALPDIRIVSAAAPASSPVFPRTTLILLAIAITSVTLQVGGIIFSELLSGRALVERPRHTHGETSSSGNESQVQTGEAQPQDEDVERGAMAVAPVPIKTARPSRTRNSIELDALLTLIRAGNERRIVVASTDDGVSSREFAELLSASVVKGGQSVAEVDAGSGERGVELGLTDLCVDDADFGDVVHRSDDGRFAFVPWGQNLSIPARSDRPATLVEALSDIYEAVIVTGGKIGLSSRLSLFAGPGVTCVLLTGDREAAEAVRSEIAALGFENVHLVESPGSESEVA